MGGGIAFPHEPYSRDRELRPLGTTSSAEAAALQASMR